MEACSTLGTTLLETLDVRASSYIESKEKCENWRSRLSNRCWCSMWTVVFRSVVEVVEGDDGFVPVVKV